MQIPHKEINLGRVLGRDDQGRKLFGARWRGQLVHAKQVRRGRWASFVQTLQDIEQHEGIVQYFGVCDGGDRAEVMGDLYALHLYSPHIHSSDLMARVSVRLPEQRLDETRGRFGETLVIGEVVCRDSLHSASVLQNKAMSLELYIHAALDLVDLAYYFMRNPTLAKLFHVDAVLLDSTAAKARIDPLKAKDLEDLHVYPEAVESYLVDSLAQMLEVLVQRDLQSQFQTTQQMHDGSLGYVLDQTSGGRRGEIEDRELRNLHPLLYPIPLLRASCGESQWGLDRLQSYLQRVGAALLYLDILPPPPIWGYPAQEEIHYDFKRISKIRSKLPIDPKDAHTPRLSVAERQQAQRFINLEKRLFKDPSQNLYSVLSEPIKLYCQGENSKVLSYYDTVSSFCQQRAPNTPFERIKHKKPRLELLMIMPVVRMTHLRNPEARRFPDYKEAVNPQDLGVTPVHIPWLPDEPVARPANLETQSKGVCRLTSSQVDLLVDGFLAQQALAVVATYILYRYRYCQKDQLCAPGATLSAAAAGLVYMQSLLKTVTPDEKHRDIKREMDAAYGRHPLDRTGNSYSLTDHSLRVASIFCPAAACLYIRWRLRINDPFVYGLSPNSPDKDLDRAAAHALHRLAHYESVDGAYYYAAYLYARAQQFPILSEAIRDASEGKIQIRLPPISTKVSTGANAELDHPVEYSLQNETQQDPLITLEHELKTSEGQETSEIGPPQIAALLVRGANLGCMRCMVVLKAKDPWKSSLRERNDPFALQIWALNVLKGPASKEDNSEAISRLVAAARAGVPMAHYILGRLFYRGTVSKTPTVVNIGISPQPTSSTVGSEAILNPPTSVLVPVNRDIAKAHLLFATENGISQACTTIANIHFAARDESTAIKYFKIAAEMLDAPACESLSRLRTSSSSSLSLLSLPLSSPPSPSSSPSSQPSREARKYYAELATHARLWDRRIDWYPDFDMD
eukprot:TRINITY_DN5036_c0_g1_i3.p1 TRINITY_DN5036_c0_g1~~TRINITY_DN5036_c0_g1_i3.p1  ORF type:complete len:966 (-),score=160.17 TRINITY_DN5036_c0_g1_i3:195-3092(-)